PSGTSPSALRGQPTPQPRGPPLSDAGSSSTMNPSQGSYLSPSATLNQGGNPAPSGRRAYFLGIVSTRPSVGSFAATSALKAPMSVSRMAAVPKSSLSRRAPR